MTKDRFKEQFAAAAATAFQQTYPDQFSREGLSQVFDVDYVYGHLESPKDPRLGRFAFPVFRYARLLGDKPDHIASRVAVSMNEVLKSAAGNGPLVECVAVRGFLNARVDPAALAEMTIRSILEAGSGYGDSEQGRGRTFLIEYSSPNIAKPFGVGHLRTTVLGNSLRRIFDKLGFRVEGINYLGD